MSTLYATGQGVDCGAVGILEGAALGIAISVAFTVSVFVAIILRTLRPLGWAILIGVVLFLIA